MHTHIYTMQKGGWNEILMYIELNCKEGMKMYVDGGHVVTTMSIYKIQVDYGGNSHTKEF